MLNNDILRRIRYIKDYSDQQMLEIFNLAGLKITKDQLNHWLKKDEDPDYIHCKDFLLT